MIDQEHRSITNDGGRDRDRQGASTYADASHALNDADFLLARAYSIMPFVWCLGCVIKCLVGPQKSLMFVGLY